MEIQSHGAPRVIRPQGWQPKFPRRVRGSKWVKNADGTESHWQYMRDASPEEEAQLRVEDAEKGLCAEDLESYRQWKRGAVARWLAKLVFWRQ
jgi:hypothetical protein